MTKTLAGLALSAMLATSACNMTADQALVVGSAGGAATGLALATLLEADTSWKIVAALAGAAAGTMVAQNLRTNQCAYADGRGGYVVRPCR